MRRRPHFLRLALASLASLSRASPEASFMRSSSIFFSLPPTTQRSRHDPARAATCHFRVKVPLPSVKAAVKSAISEFELGPKEQMGGYGAELQQRSSMTHWGAHGGKTYRFSAFETLSSGGFFRMKVFSLWRMSTSDVCPHACSRDLCLH